MDNDLGVIQGRLLPKYRGKYQAHPVGYWEEEFEIAKNLELDCIEFILDFENIEENPLIKEGGVDEIIKYIKKTNVRVNSVCADYLMDAPLHSENIEIANSSQNMLIKLLNNVENLGTSSIVIPCVDQSSLSNEIEIEKFIKYFSPVVKVAEKFNINLALETDLNPHSFIKLIETFDSSKVNINYDIGNSAYLGFDPIEELDCYGEKITNIHIKDRVLGGASVELGQGDANFKSFFEKLKQFHYTGPYILQAFRDNEGVEIFKRQLTWIKEYLPKQ